MIDTSEHIFSQITKEEYQATAEEAKIQARFDALTMDEFEAFTAAGDETFQAAFWDMNKKLLISTVTDSEKIQLVVKYLEVGYKEFKSYMRGKNV